METSDNWVGLEHLILEKLRIMLNFTDNESCAFLFLKCHLCPMNVHGLLPHCLLHSPYLPHPPIILFIIIFDLDRSQATYHNETAECVLETLSQH